LIFEAVVYEGDAPGVRAAFDRLQTRLALRLFQFEDRRFVLICWPAGAPRHHAVDEVNRIAEVFSREFGTALAVHYDDRCGVKVSVLYRSGSPIREFTEADEVWTPIDDDGEPISDGPQYPGDAIPDDVECDCIRQAIDVALDAAGFGGWLTEDELQDWACTEDLWIAQRLGSPN
jgi:hypothetical protein